MKSIEEICEKFAVQNALEHGEAKIGPVMGKVMSAHPELRKKANEVKDIALKQIDLINTLTVSEIQQIAQDRYPDLLKEDKSNEQEGTDFIRAIVEKHMETGRFNGKVRTRFPPEPNGFLHIGHAFSILYNYNLAKEYNGTFNFRFDDTNPIKEEDVYVKGMIEDIKWLDVYEKRGDDDNVLFGSDYFQQFYDYALQLVEKGLAYVDDLSADEISELRGTLTEPGEKSPYRDRPVEENLDLFKRMKVGEFPDGAKVLRAKIDMAHPNMNMRDPVMYRILHKSHHNTGDKWCVYPMYDWAHGLEDSIEGITHSICTLEFENHRPLYDWFLDQLEDEENNPIHHPQQIEFARVNVSHTVLSKRRALILVNEGYVNGWDDPRLLTITGLRKAGVPVAAIRSFCESIGISKRDRIIDRSILDHHIREELNKICPRTMAVIDPLKVVITNYPEGKEEKFEVSNHPFDTSYGTRKITFSREIYIDRDDFMENPPDDFYRLSKDREVRLKYAYLITCDEIIRDEKTDQIVQLNCSYDPKTYGGKVPDGRNVRGTIHWISVAHAEKTTIHLYDRLCTRANPMDTEEGKEFTEYVNPDSFKIKEAYVEPYLIKEELGTRVQFERNGYFYLSPYESTQDNKVFIQIISLKDSWSK